MVGKFAYTEKKACELKTAKFLTTDIYLVTYSTFKFLLF